MLEDQKGELSMTDKGEAGEAHRHPYVDRTVLAFTSSTRPKYLPKPVMCVSE